MPPGGFCETKPCWIGSPKGYKYGDKARSADGVFKMSLVAGSPGAGKIVVKGKGPGLDMPALPLVPPVRIQLAQSANATCWDASYGTVLRNDALQFKAKSD